MPQIIRNRWRRPGGGACARAPILTHDVHPEGLDLERLRFESDGTLPLAEDAGHILTVLRGRARLETPRSETPRSETLGGPLQLEGGVHVYVPPGAGATLTGEAGARVVHVRSPSPAQARGTRLLVRDEAFLVACASQRRAYRWVLTPQYLSRRVFLHHDETLLSAAGEPVSWFRTTMFDVAGLPPNEDGEPVFKMSYNHRTEPNVCYDVAGRARVRFARHPYRGEGQAWGRWCDLDGETTYYLDEAAGGPEVEWRRTAEGARRPLRNKHEVSIIGGHVSLLCLFDPAPTGLERHRAGEYSEYGSLDEALESEQYAAHLESLQALDAMVDELSLAKARGELAALEGGATWRRFQEGRAAQVRHEAALLDAARAEGRGRAEVLRRWATG